MAHVASRNDGLEWVNLQPWVDPDQLPRVSLLRHIFSSKGQPVPTGTWVPGHTSGKEPTSTEVGIQHGFGVGALARLNEQAVAIPADWTVIQEDTRRGLVFTVARGEDPRVALDFMVAACAALSGVDTDDRWLAGFCMRAGTGDPAG